MGSIFTLTSGIKAVIQQALDDLITELGKPCKLVYPPRFVSCTNCVFDAIGQKSSNHWRNGGPMQFADGMSCPMCNGVGRIAQEVSEPIKLLCEWKPGNFVVPVPNLQLYAPNSLLQTKGYMSDLPKLMRADRLVYQTAIGGLLNQTFQLLGEPGDKSNIIQNRYCVATWQRQQAT
jgi:hypothetical protein